jgi:hypothetical protein
MARSEARGCVTREDVCLQHTLRSAQLGQSAAQVAHGLADALLILDEGEPHMAVTTRTEPDTGRGGHVGLLHEVLGELE